jgi:hypothetical protein
MSIEIGEVHRFSQKFTDAAGADADPVFVEFWLREGVDGTELQWTYTTIGPVTTSPAGFSSIIAKDSVGDFHLDFNARKPERLTGHWVGVGTVLVNAPETVFVRYSGISAIDNP